MPRSALALAVLVAAAAPATANTPAEAARDHYAAANKAFNLARYDDAIREFEAAYQAVEDPAFIYNLAQAHRLAGHLEQAIRFYRNYLRLDPATSMRADIEARIQEMERTLRSQHTQQAAPPSGTMRPAEPLAQPPPTTGTPATAPTRPAPRALRVAGIALAAAGVAVGVGGAVGFALAAQERADAIRAQALAQAPFDPSLDEDRRLFRTLAIVAGAAGAALAVAGTVLIVLGVRGRAERAVAVAPVIGAGGAGLALAGSF